MRDASATKKLSATVGLIIKFGKSRQIVPLPLPTTLITPGGEQMSL